MQEMTSSSSLALNTNTQRDLKSFRTHVIRALHVLSPLHITDPNDKRVLTLAATLRKRSNGK